MEADYYDGVRARRHRVQLRAGAGALEVEIDGVWQHWPLARLAVGERLGSAPRRIDLHGAGHLEIADGAAGDACLRAAGHRDGWVDRWQRHWGPALAGLLATVLLIVAALRWGLPWLAARVAPAFPPALVETLSTQTLAALEARWLQPSALPAARQQALAAAFARIARPGESLLLRRSPALGANALALPDGRVLLLDGLVELADHDEQVLAVLAHELAHVRNAHPQRLLVQTALVGVFSAWWFGDLSALAAAPAALLGAGYSRDLESEADATAARLLREQGIAPARLGEMLDRLEAAGPASAGRSGAEPAAGLLRYLDSHPTTPERRRALESTR